MKDWLLKKIISGFLLLVLCLGQFSFFVHPAQAQLSAFSGSAQGGFSLSGIGGVLAQCAGGANLISQGISAAGSAIGGLFGGGGGGSGDDNNNEGGSGIVNDLSKPIKNPVTNQEVPVKDSQLRGTAKEIKKETNAIKKEEQSANRKEQCLDAIARYAVLKVIDRITFATVKWINSGFQGNPFYPENLVNFFENLAKDEVLNFTSWFSGNPESYPFGQVLSETILLTVQNRLEDNLRFSLNQVIQHSNQYAGYDTFRAQFSAGGWAGYTAFSQPNNNIFGNYLMANQYLGRRVAGTNYNLAANFKQELQAGSGILNQRECAKTAANDQYYTSGDEYIDPENPRYLGGRPLIPEGGTMTQAIYESLPPAVQEIMDAQNGTDAQAFEYNTIVRRSTCLEWRTVTPGRFLADQTTQALGSPLRTLELGDELNENLGLIFDALANQLFKKIAGGVRSLYNSSNTYSSDPSSSNYNPLWAQVNNQDFGANSSSQSVPVEIVLTGDGVSPGLVAIQQDYLAQASQNITLISTLIRDIRVLDYCVPGPQPNWYTEATSNLQDLVNQIPESNAFEPELRQAYYTNAISGLTGININPFLLPPQALSTYDDFLSFMNYVYSRYRDAIFESYSLTSAPPAARPFLPDLLNQVLQYQETIQQISTQIADISALMPQLLNIEQQLLALGENPDPTSPEMQTITSLVAQLNNQGVLVTQAQVDQIAGNALIYQSRGLMLNNLIDQCVNEVTSGYLSPNERVSYPFTSITEHPAFQELPPPVALFSGSQQFNDDGNGLLDVSEWNDYNLNIPTTSTATFAQNLGSLY